MARNHQLTGYSRVFLIDGGARPSAAPAYQGLMKAGAFSWPQGDITLVRIPDPNRYGKFLVVGKVPGEEGNVELTLMARYTTDLSTLFKLARKKCDIDIHIHMGLCEDPRNFNLGYDKALIIRDARITTYGTTDLGALGSDENAIVNEEVPVSGEDAIELVRMTFGTKAATQVAREVVDIEICDTEACGECGVLSDGCQIVLATTRSSDASPGLPAEVIATRDGGSTWVERPITSLGATEDPNDSDCVGSNLVVVSAESISLHYANIADILNSVETWNEVTTGFVAGGAPRAIHSVSSVWTWIVGLGGYVYVASDPTSGVTVQDAGVATTQQLNAIHAIDELVAVAVGNSNAVIRTVDGSTWSSVTGPAVGVNLNTVWMHSETTWFVGTAGGRLYYTEDSGATWTEKSFPGSGAGQVRHIAFFDGSVGYMAHSSAVPAGRILRTIDGGYSWYIIPEQTGFIIPANDYIGKLAVCADPNTVFGGGLADDAVDGIILKGFGA